MSANLNANRRKVLIEQANDIPDFEPGFNIFGRIVKCQAGDLFQVEIIDEKKATTIAKGEETPITVVIAKMLPKFKHVIYAKPADLVIITPETDEFNTRAAYHISAILSQAHIIAFIKDRSLPSYFTPEQFAHKVEAASMISGGTATNRILTSKFMKNNDNSDEDEDLPMYNNRRRNPFLGSGSSDDDSD